ncbi:hypothetical protein LCGC14_1729880 [marine sediment metagenome]|uniref:Uncharacterized protein n=1 Tax=marine sediment metagenome TaxID=412755 RepID=A0A0F9H9Y7_9ZZZZ
MGRIGPDYWHWTTVDTPGVPTGGKYGDVDAFVKLIEPHGFKLAWSQIWDCFCLYEEVGTGKILDHWHFIGRPTVPIALDKDWLDVFLELRETAPRGTSLIAEMAKVAAEQKYLDQCEEEAMYAELEKPVMRALDVQEQGPRPFFIMPGVPGGN